MPVSLNGRKRPRTDADEAVPASIEDQDLSVPRTPKRAKLGEKRSIFVRSIPGDATNESLTDFFSQHFPVKHAVVVVDKKTQESRGYGFVTFADADDASEAQKTLDKKEWSGRRIRIDIAEPRQRNESGEKNDAVNKRPKKDDFQAPPKLIVRNLPWTIKTSEQLSRLFISFGKVKFADLPQAKGKLRGFGFVTLRGRKNAEKALEGINGKEIDGRTLAVDWAVDKSVWDSQQTKSGEDGGEDGGEADARAEDDAEAGEIDKDEGDSGDKGLDADLQNFMKNHMQNMEDEDEDEDKETSGGKNPRRDEPAKKSTDNSATVFIRNLPFTTTDELLKSFFNHFGKIRYARVVIDKATDKPAGTGFVCFVSESDCKSCIKGAPRQEQPSTKTKQSILHDESADPEGHYTLDGRLLQVSQAVNKEEANSLADSSMAKRRETDKRRLFLLSEGAISSGSPLHDLLTPAEIQMRQASSNQRKKMVQGNPTLHISLTRLALRNIPRNVGSKELKELARAAIVGFAKDVKEGRRQHLSKEENARDGKDAKELEHQRRLKGKGIVRQAKIVVENMQGTKVAEKSGAGKSRGYGFIEYTSHHWALMGLRYLNGHQLQGDNGRKQRLVVEFAIENAQVVQRRRTAANQANQPAESKGRANLKKSSEAKGHVDGGEEAVSQRKSKRKPKQEADEAVDEDDGSADPKTAMKQKLIGRKRLMRKKKANARGQK